jgi:D-xylulose reductase
MPYLLLPQPWDSTPAKYYIVAADYCVRLPGHMDVKQGALVEPVVCAVQMTKVGKVRANQDIVMFGYGLWASSVRRVQSFTERRK